MKINYFMFVLSLFFSGCIFTYDPPRKNLRVYNFSDSAVYVYFSSTDSIQLQPELKLFIKFPYERSKVNDKVIDTLSSPDYRINAHFYSYLTEKSVSSSKWIPFKDKNIVTFFFIKESIMRTHTWKEIFEGQLYTKKIKYSYSQLENLGYEIYYKP